jgi:hypothetical protein
MIEQVKLKRLARPLGPREGEEGKFVMELLCELKI